MTPLRPAALDAVPTADQPLDRAGLREAAQGFEAIFVRRMLEAARAADLGGDEIFGGAGLKQFTAMQDEHLAEIAAAEGAFGIAEAIEAQLAARMNGAAE